MEPVDRPPPLSVLTPAAPGNLPYSVPRRYGMDMLLAVVTGFSLLFGALAAIGTPPVAILIVVAFVVGVGLAQAVLFGGKQPRLASTLAGFAMWELISVALIVVDGPGGSYAVEAFVIGSCVGLFFGPPLGYCAGWFAASVFMFLDYAEWWWARRRCRPGMTPSPSLSDNGEPDPFGPADERHIRGLNKNRN